MKRGDVIWWVVVDATTGEPVSWYASRSTARRVAMESGGRYARVVLV
jgi:hypothetical protein